MMSATIGGITAAGKHEEFVSYIHQTENISPIIYETQKERGAASLYLTSKCTKDEFYYGQLNSTNSLLNHTNAGIPRIETLLATVRNLTSHTCLNKQWDKTDEIFERYAFSKHPLNKPSLNPVQA